MEQTVLETKILQLHEFVRLRNLEGIQAFVDKFPFEKHACNAKGESAASVALKSCQIDIYDHLLSKNLMLKPSEDIVEILETLEATPNTNEIKSRLREIHKKYFKDPHLKHLIRLSKKTKLCYNNSNADKRNYRTLIVEAYEDLNEIKFIEPILRVVAYAKLLDIVFDFNSKSVEQMNPNSNKHSRGVTCHEEGYIYVGAEDLLDVHTRNNALGTLAHELCHYAMQLIYKNNCKPYYAGSLMKETEFNKIVDYCKQLENPEPIISFVFDYEITKWHAELIVRIPHLLAQYNNDENFDCEECLSQLYVFYEQNTLIDLNQMFPLMETCHVMNKINEYCEINNIFEMSEHSIKDLPEFKPQEVFIIKSNLCQLTFSSYHQKLKQSEGFEHSYIFISFDHLRIGRLMNMLVKVSASKVKPTVIVNCKDVKQIDIQNAILSLKEKGLFLKFVFITEDDVSLQLSFCEIEHSWEQLKLESQENLMNREMIFQGINVKLQDLTSKDSMCIQNIPLKLLTSKHNIVLGEEIENFQNDEQHIKRFLYELRYSQNEYFSNDIINQVEDHKAMVITDDPGMGKTTELRAIAKCLKEKFPFKWVVFLRLKDHIEAFKNAPNQFQDPEEISSFLCEKVLRLKHFQAGFFKELFLNDLVCLLFDGFDEVSPSFTNLILHLSSVILDMTKNQLWLSSRPHMSESFAGKFSFKEFKFQRFNYDDDCIEFCKKVVSFKIRSRDDTLSSEELNGIMKKVNMFLTKFLEYPFDNLLLLTMTTDIFIEDNLNYDWQHSHSFKIYEYFTNKMINVFVNKGKEAEDQSRIFLTTSLNIIQIHQQKALESFFGFSEKLMETIISLYFQDSIVLSDEQFVRIGLMRTFVDETYFIHETFADFFIADFLKQKCFQSSSYNKEQLEPVFDLLLTILTNCIYLQRERIKMIEKFLDYALNGLEVSEDSMVFNILKSRFSHLDETKYSNVVFHLVEYGCINLIKKVKTFDDEKMYDLLLTVDKNHMTVLMKSVESNSLTFIKEFWMFVSTHLGTRIKDILGQCNGRNVLNLCIENDNFDLFVFYHRKCKELMEDCEVMEMLRGNVLGNVNQNNNIFLSFERWSTVNKFDELCKVIAKNMNESVVDSLIKSAVECDGCSNIMVHACYTFNSSELTSLYEKLSSLFSRREIQKLVLKESDHLLSAIVTNKKPGTFETFWEIIKTNCNLKEQEQMLLRRALHEDGILLFSLYGSSDETFAFAIELYQEVLGDAQLKKIIATPNVNREGLGENFIFSLNKFGSNYNKVNSLWSKMQELFEIDELKELMTNEDEKILESLLKASEKYEKYEKFLSVFWPFLLTHLSNDELDQIGFFNYFLHAFEYLSVHSLSCIFNTEVNIAFFQKLFRHTDSQGRNILHIGIKHKRHEAFKILLQKASSDESFSSNIKALDNNSNNIIFNALAATKTFNPKIVFCDKNIYILREYIEIDQLKALLKALNAKGDTILHRLCCNLDSGELKSSCRVINRFFEQQELCEIYAKRSAMSNSPPVLQAALNKHHGVFEVFWRFLEQIFDEETLRNFLLLKNTSGEVCILQYSLRGNSFAFATGLYERFDKPEMINIMCSADDKGEVFLYRVYKGKCDKTEIEELWGYMQTLLNEQELKNILRNKNIENKTIIDIARMTHEKASCFSVFLPFFNNHFSKDENQEIALFDFIFEAHENDFYDFISSMINLLTISLLLKQLFFEVDSKGRSVLHFAAKNFSLFKFYLIKAKSLIDSVEFKKLLNKRDAEEKIFLYNSYYHFDEILVFLNETIGKEEVSCLISSTQFSKQTLFHDILVKERNFKLFSRLNLYLSFEELEKFHFRSTNYNGETLLMLAVGNLYYENNFFGTYWKYLENIFIDDESRRRFTKIMKKCIIKKNVEGKTVLSYLIKNFQRDTTNFNVFWSFMQNSFDDNTLTEFFASEITKNVVNPLYTSFYYEDRYREIFMLVLPSVVRTISNNNKTVALMVLNYVTECSPRLFEHFLNELETASYPQIIYRVTNVKEENIFHLAARNCFVIRNYWHPQDWSSKENIPILSMLLGHSKKLIGIYEMKNLIQAKDSSGYNVFFHVLKISSMSIEIVCQSFREIFDCNFMKRLIKSKDNSGLSFLHYSHKEMTEDNRPNPSRWLSIGEKYLAPNELTKIYEERVLENSSNLFMQFAIHFEYKSFEIVFSNFEKVDVINQKRILLERDDQSRTIFHYMLLGHTNKKFDKITKYYEDLLGIDDFKEIIMQENFYFETIFFLFCIEKTYVYDSMKRLWQYLKQLKIDDSLLIKILTTQNKKGKTFFEQFKEDKNLGQLQKILEIVEPFIETKMSTQEQNSLGVFKFNLTDRTCLKPAIDDVISHCKKEEIFEMLVKNGDTTFHLIIGNQQGIMFELYINQNKELLSVAELKEKKEIKAKERFLTFFPQFGGFENGCFDKFLKVLKDILEVFDYNMLEKKLIKCKIFSI